AAPSAAAASATARPMPRPAPVTAITLPSRDATRTPPPLPRRGPGDASRLPSSLVKPSGIHHVSICVEDCNAAIAFYTDVLGMTVLPRPDFGFGGAWLEAGGQQLHLMEFAPGELKGQHFAIRVDDLQEAVDDIRSHGVRVDV